MIKSIKAQFEWAIDVPTKEQIAARYRKWIAALRSGEYKQGRGWLRPEKDEFCCLGVLLDLGDNTKRTEDGWITSFGKVGCVSHLPAPVCYALSLSVEDRLKLISLNDAKKYSFNKIADYIETEILPRFL